jgi:hypothetical protein
MPRELQLRFARLAAAIRAEIDRRASVVAEAEQALRDFAKETPSMRELRGIGDIVHDFYTGIERIFEKIAPELNGGVPAGTAWHRELLENMTLDLPGVRPPVITRKTADDSRSSCASAISSGISTDSSCNGTGFER